jgi:hypothetical protein
MAARLNPRHTELVLRRIKTSQLVNRLQDNAMGKIQPQLSKSQVDSATFLVERLIAKASAPKDINLTGSLQITWPLPKGPLDV